MIRIVDMIKIIDRLPRGTKQQILRMLRGLKALLIFGLALGALVLYILSWMHYSNVAIVITVLGLSWFIGTLVEQ